MIRITIAGIFLTIFFATQVFSQENEKWSLEDCINYALENNIQVKQQELNAKYSNNQLKQAKADLYPNLNASASQNFSFGRTIDPYTNEFNENDIRSNSFSINSSVTLFDGLRNVNTIKKNNYDFMAAVQDLEKMKNDISLNIATAYLQILYNHERVKIALDQLRVTELQIERTKKLVEAGSLARGSLLEIQAQAANEELTVINAENDLRMSYLTLTQLLDLKDPKDFDIIQPEFGDISTKELPLTAQMIFLEAQGLPQIKSAEHQLSSAQKQVDIAKGSRYPTLTLNASYSTGYSNARELYDRETGTVPIGYIGSNPDQLVYTDNAVTNVISKTYPFGDQISDNANTALYFSLRIPIFTNFQIKHGIENAKLNHENMQHSLQLARNQLFKDIQQAYDDAKAALARYNGSKKALDAMKESFKYTQQKFDVGLVNSVDYNLAKKQLAETESQLLQAKYEFIFTRSILDFYRGKPITLK